VVAVGDLKTNGEHWVIFRFDAPRKRAVQIVTVQVRGSDNNPVITYPLPSGTVARALSIPDSTVPISELVKAGSSNSLRCDTLEEENGESDYASWCDSDFEDNMVHVLEAAGERRV